MCSLFFQLLQLNSMFVRFIHVYFVQMQLINPLCIDVVYYIFCRVFHCVTVLQFLLLLMDCQISAIMNILIQIFWYTFVHISIGFIQEQDCWVIDWSIIYIIIMFIYFFIADQSKMKIYVSFSVFLFQNLCAIQSSTFLELFDFFFSLPNCLN